MHKRFAAIVVTNYLHRPLLPVLQEALAEDGVDTEDPSNVKRFVSSFSAEQGGGLVRVYSHQISSKLVAITVEHYSKIIVTFSSGIRKWTVS